MTKLSELKRNKIASIIFAEAVIESGLPYETWELLYSRNHRDQILVSNSTVRVQLEVCPEVYEIRVSNTVANRITVILYKSIDGVTYLKEPIIVWVEDSRVSVHRDSHINMLMQELHKAMFFG